MSAAAVTDPVRVQAEKERVEERRRLKAVIAAAAKAEKSAHGPMVKTADAYWRIASKNLDAEPSKAEVEADAKAKAKLAVWDRAHREHVRASEALAALEGPEWVERRMIEINRKLDRDRPKRRKEDDEMSSVATKRSSKPRRSFEVPPKVLAKVIKLVKETEMSVPEISERLNKDGVEGPSSGKWEPTDPYFVLRVGGAPISSLRGKKVGARASANGASRKAAGASRKTGGSRKASAGRKKSASAAPAKPRALPKREVTPLDKKAQAAGTSRGGSGRKAKVAGRKVRGSRKR